MRWDETQKVLANSRLGEKDTSAVCDGPSCVEREMEPHILFADDSPDLRELVQLLLQAFVCQPLTVPRALYSSPQPNGLTP